MNKFPFTHLTSFSQAYADDTSVEGISLAAIEAEKLQMQFPEHGYMHPVLSNESLDLEKLTDLLTALRQTNDQIFQMKYEYPYFRISVPIFWRGLISGSPAQLSALLQQSAQHSIHPYLRSYLRKFGDLDMSSVTEQWYSTESDAESDVACLNSRVDGLRSDLRSPDTARAVDNLRRSYRSNLASLQGYVSDLFERYSRLLVVRLDLGYRQGLSINRHMAQCNVVVSNRPEHGVSSQHERYAPRGSGVSIDLIRQHREELLKFIRDSFGNDFCGYAWKLEYGARKGYHYHLVLFFNGANLRRDVAIGASIGNHWRDTITSGLGNYYNCNAEANSYRHPCVGSQSWNSPRLRTGMSYLCAYLMKQDLYARLELAPGQRTFGKGGSPLKGWSEQPRRGRPRSM